MYIPKEEAYEETSSQPEKSDGPVSFSDILNLASSPSFQEGKTDFESLFNKVDPYFSAESAYAFLKQ